MRGNGERIFSRNLLWITPRVQARILESRLVVVGCGGNGVVFTVYAAHLGFRRFTLCDADYLDATNLNRYVIATPEQVGTQKTEVIKSYLQARFDDLQITCINRRFPNTEILSAFPTATLIIGCLDNPLSRIELDVLSRKYEKVLLDLGSGFIMEESSGGEMIAVGAGGQVILSRPDNACLKCLGFDLDATRNSYFLVDGVPEPSSLLLNSIVGSLAVEHAISEACGNLAPINRISYDRESCSIIRETLLGKDDCRICGMQSREHVRSVADFSLNPPDIGRS